MSATVLTERPEDPQAFVLKELKKIQVLSLWLGDSVDNSDVLGNSDVWDPHTHALAPASPPEEGANPSPSPSLSPPAVGALAPHPPEGLRAQGAPENPGARTLFSPYRGTSLMRQRTSLGPYRRPMPRVMGGGGVFLRAMYPCADGLP